MTAGLVYILCATTSALCAVLLLRQYTRTSTRLLLWSGAAFAGFAVSNVLVFTDLVVFPDIDLSLVRAVASCASVSVLLYGLVWDAD